VDGYNLDTTSLLQLHHTLSSRQVHDKQPKLVAADATHAWRNSSNSRFNALAPAWAQCWYGLHAHGV
jgi:hypothetical protein